MSPFQVLKVMTDALGNEGTRKMLSLEANKVIPEVVAPDSVLESLLVFLANALSEEIFRRRVAALALDIETAKGEIIG